MENTVIKGVDQARPSWAPPLRYYVSELDRWGQQARGAIPIAPLPEAVLSLKPSARGWTVIQVQQGLAQRIRADCWLREDWTPLGDFPDTLTAVRSAEALARRRGVPLLLHRSMRRYVEFLRACRRERAESEAA